MKVKWEDNKMKILRSIALVALMVLMFSGVALGVCDSTNTNVVGAFGIYNVIDAETLTVELSGKNYDDTMKRVSLGETIELTTEDNSETYHIKIDGVSYYTGYGGSVVDVEMSSDSGLIKNRLFEEDWAKIGYQLQFYERGVVAAFGISQVIDNENIIIELSGRDYDDTKKSVSLGETIELTTSDNSETYYITISSIDYFSGNSMVDVEISSDSGLIKNRLFEEDQIKMGYQLQFYNKVCSEEPTCTDSDGGRNEFIRGTISGNFWPTDEGADIVRENNYKDFCVNDRTVAENYCSSNGYITGRDITCPTNYVCQSGACIETATEDSTFSVAVNDYPDHRNHDQTINLAYAYVNMYTVKLSNGKFKVIDVETKRTGSQGQGAEFTIPLGQIVEFGGFRTKAGAEEGAEKKSRESWTAPPPYKNFGTASNELCQTHWTKTYDFLQHSEDYACATSLSTPYQDVVLHDDFEIIEEVTIEETELKCGDSYGGDGYYSACKKDTVKHNTGVGFKVISFTDKSLVLDVVGTGKEFVFSKQREVIKFNYRGYSYKVEYNYYDTRGRVTIRITHEQISDLVPISSEEEVEIVEIEVIEETEEVSSRELSCGGCQPNGNCLPYGTRLIHKGDAVYCHFDSTLREQVKVGKSCQNNYECLSNQCSNGECVDISRQLSQTQGMLEKIFNWLARIFG